MQDNNMQDNNMQDMYNIDNLSSIGDYNTNNKDSFNTYNYLTTVNLNCPPIDSIKNSNNRTLLKNMVGKQIQIWAYAVGERCVCINKFNGVQVVRYTIINVHSKDNYIADHIQLDISIDKYDPDIERQIIFVRGEVYEYQTNGETKQSIFATEVNFSKANELIINTDFIKPKFNGSESDIEQTILDIAKYNPDEKFKLLIKANDYLNRLVLGMPKDFISNYIINQYMINENPDSMNRADLSLLRNDDISILETTFLILSIAKDLSEGNFRDMYSIFKCINSILNNMQGFGEDDNINHTKVKKFPYQIKNFCNNHKLDCRKAYRYIKKRNSNFDGCVINKAVAYHDALEIIYMDLKEENLSNVLKLNKENTI